MPISESAFAKINLSLQIVGRRHDGYHLLDSLVAFADLGDTLDIEPAENLSLITCGRYSAALPDDPDDNLVLRAARWLNDATGAKITLHKELPVASGMGGGSADAAAAIRGLARSWDVPVPAAIETECLGADVPVCVGSVTARVRGVGEQVEPVTCLPPLPVVLVNPGRQVSTGRVFSEYGPVTHVEASLSSRQEASMSIRQSSGFQVSRTIWRQLPSGWSRQSPRSCRPCGQVVQGLFG